MTADAPPADAPVTGGSVQTGTMGRTDPYAVWAHLTQGAYLARHGGGPFRVALALHAGAAALEAVRGCVRVSPHYARQDHPPPRYLTGWIDALTGPAIETLVRHAEVVLAEPGMWPGGGPGSDAAPRWLPSGTSDPGSPRGKGVDVPADVGQPVEPSPAPSRGRFVVGVIDGRVAFANERFRGPAGHGSRIEWLWDQGDAAAGAWNTPREFDYGRELDAQAIGRVLDEHVHGGGSRTRGGDALRDAERDLYAALDYALPQDADWSHGTHVLGTVLAGLDAPEPAEPARIIYVQLPEVALRDTSGRWAAAQVLDGLHYILARAGDAEQVVVNLSLGAFAGPHDGSSVLERAIDALIEAQQGRLIVVVAAGNAGLVTDDGSGAPKAVHARATLGAGGAPAGALPAASAQFCWEIDRPDSTESFLEVWLPELPHEGQRPRVSVGLARVVAGTPATIDVLAPVAAGRYSLQAAVAAGGAGPLASVAVFNCSGPARPPNGHGGLVLVALGHTADPSGGASVQTGTWIVTVRNESPWPLTIDAWIERRDVPGELPGLRPQYGFGVGTQAALIRSGSLASLANGARTLVVGALEPDVADPSRLLLSDYSSLGVAAVGGECNARAVQRLGPDLYAPGRHEAVSFLSGPTTSLAGTSMASAQVTCTLARLLSSGHRFSADKGALVEALCRGGGLRAGPPRP